MVAAFNHKKRMQKSRSLQFTNMFENPGKQTHRLIIHGDQNKCSSFVSRHDSEAVLNRDNSPEEAPKCLPPKPLSDIDLMKERFAKLLLGEDMSGAGNGVSSALALSNAITNLAASVFGQQSKLEPMSADRKARWRKELDWLLSVADHIVEFVPSQQTAKDGSSMEIMTTRQRFDLLINIPALRKLDTMLIDTLDQFKDQNEFWYVSKHEDESEGNTTSQRSNDKWWLPTVKVPQNGLSEEARKWMHLQRDSVNQVLKAAMAINAQVLSEMEIPENYIESLPKNGRESLGDLIYKCITVEYFDPAQFLSTMDLSTEHKVLDLKNRMEASKVIWKRKMNSKDGKSPWGSAVSLEKRELFEERAETILLIIKQQFPGLPQSSLDISKIQYNKDVGQSILESYSRVLESLAFTIMSRIKDVLSADTQTGNPSTEVCSRKFSADSLPSGEDKPPNSGEEFESTETPSQMTLSDIMGWGSTKKNNSTGDLPDYFKEKSMSKSPTLTKRTAYLEKIEVLKKWER